MSGMRKHLLHLMQHIKSTTLCLTALLLVASGSARADSGQYQIMLGNRHIGLLQFEEDGRTTRLVASLANTPLGLADGTFSAVTTDDDGVANYLSQGRGSKVRDIVVTRHTGTVAKVTVTPRREMTELSDPSKVPAGVISPTEVFQELRNASACPTPVNMYDGRRVVRLATVAMTQEGNSVTCDLSYRVVLGPGHLAPFYFNALKLQVAYTDSTLIRISVTAGIFRLHLLRQ